MTRRAMREKNRNPAVVPLQHAEANILSSAQPMGSLTDHKHAAVSLIQSMGKGRAVSVPAASPSMKHEDNPVCPRIFQIITGEGQIIPASGLNSDKRTEMISGPADSQNRKINTL